MPTRLVHEANGSDELVFEVAEGEWIVGRAVNCDIHVHDSLVSRRHCALIARQGALFIIDFSSKNGTFVNGVRIGIGEVQLQYNDVVTIGWTTLRVGLD